MIGIDDLGLTIGNDDWQSAISNHQSSIQYGHLIPTPGAVSNPKELIMRNTSLIVCVLLASVGAGLYAQAPASPAPPTVVTSGQASVRRPPDIATISLGVESRARNPRDAQRQNAEAMT